MKKLKKLSIYQESFGSLKKYGRAKEESHQVNSYLTDVTEILEITI